jgi:DNA-binding PadR family transcriptional regulator
VSDRKLTTASYLVLGLVELAGAASPYELKEMAAQSVAKFWALPHTQIYTQCDRLVAAGLLAERREAEGRRRRELTITSEGSRALAAWRAAPPDGHYELRDEAILKLFFGADPREIAAQRIPAHEEQLAYLRSIEQELGEGLAEGQRLALEIGIGHEREFLRFWKSYLRG